MNKLYYIPIILSILIVIIIIVYYTRVSSRNQSYRFYYNNRINNIQKELFQKNNIHSNNKDWNIYLPKGYNNIEKELLTIRDNNYGQNKFIFGINGCDWFVSKNGLWFILSEYYGRKDASKLMPTSYILYDKNDMIHFSNNFNNEYYILKKNIQRKTGLKITNNYNEIINAKKEDFKVAQKYVHNTFLVNNRKLNIRIFILIIYNKNKNIYIYNKGKCIYTNKEYDKDSLDFESNITSYKMDYIIYNKNPYSLEELNKYILDKYKIKVNIFDKIYHLLKYVCHPIRNYISKSDNIMNSTTYQLFGIDILLDNNLNPYILEINKGPDMNIRCKQDEILKKNLYKNVYSKLNIIKYKNNNFVKLISLNK